MMNTIAALAAAGTDPAAHAAEAPRPALLKPRRLGPGDVVALVNPGSAIHERMPFEVARETIAAMGFVPREMPHLRARYGHFAGTDAQRAADINAAFADPSVQGILALTGGSGGTRLLPLVDYAAIARTPKFFGGFSDLTALVNAIHQRTGLVTFHCPMADSEWNEYSLASFRAQVQQGEAPTIAIAPPETRDTLVPKAGRVATIRGGRARGPLVGGNLAVLAAMAGSPWWPRFDGAIVFLEDVNEYIYRVDRMLSTLRNAGAFARCAGVVLGAFTNCTPGEDRFGSLTLDEVFDDYFKDLGVPVFGGASFGHIRRKATLPLGVTAEIDAQAGTIRLLESAVA